MMDDISTKTELTVLYQRVKQHNTQIVAAMPFEIIQQNITQKP